MFRKMHWKQGQKQFKFSILTSEDLKTKYEFEPVH